MTMMQPEMEAKIARIHDSEKAAVLRLIQKHVPADRILETLSMFGFIEIERKVPDCKKGLHAMTPANKGLRGGVTICNACRSLERSQKNRAKRKARHE
jgi:hypothetical protein